MLAYEVEKSIDIHLETDQIKQSLTNLKEWQSWSPWIVMEPDAALTYNDKQGKEGACHGWSGNLIGSGSLEVVKIKNNLIEMKLRFIKPFKSKADVMFKLEPLENKLTKVTWLMKSEMPWFIFWMKKTMSSYISMDFQRGLLMLKEYFETGKVSSFVSVEGIVSLEGVDYIGIERSSSIDEMPKLMQKDFESLDNFIKKYEITPDRTPFSLYKSFDQTGNQTTFLSCIPISHEILNNIDIDPMWVLSAIPECDALKTRHRGSYMHLGNAWATALNYANQRRIKISSDPAGYEFYINDPRSTPSDRLVTEIYIPLEMESFKLYSK